MHKKINFLIICSFVQIAQCSILDFFKETKLFTQEIIHNYNEVGALFSCSSFTAHELTRYITAHNSSDICYILEIGAGTGPITEKIARIIESTPDNHTQYIFDVIEINEKMCKYLRAKFYDRPFVQIRCCSILDWNPPYKYDYIISTLPHTSLNTILVKDIVYQYKKLAKPNGILSYIEYIGVAKLRELVLRNNAKKDFIEIRRLLKKLRKKHTLDTKAVMLNILPLYVHHLQFK